MPPTDFSTEGMSEQAQKQIEELSIAKRLSWSVTKRIQ